MDDFVAIFGCGTDAIVSLCCRLRQGMGSSLFKLLLAIVRDLSTKRSGGIVFSISSMPFRPRVNAQVGVVDMAAAVAVIRFTSVVHGHDGMNAGNGSTRSVRELLHLPFSLPKVPKGATDADCGQGNALHEAV
jgi:hypothetical protein